MAQSVEKGADGVLPSSPSSSSPLRRNVGLALPRAAVPSLAIGLVWVAITTLFAVGEYQTFNSTSRDVGVYLQILWNTPHGRPFWTTVLESNRVHLAEHVALLLPVLGCLFAIVPDARWLFVAQQLVLAAAGIPVYLLARRVLGGVWLPTLFVAGYFGTPAVAEVASDAFYPVTWSALPLGFAAYFVLTDRWRRGAALALLAMSIEEETGLIVIGLGLYLLLNRPTRQLGAALMATGTFWLVAIALVVMPAFHDPTTVPRAASTRTVGHFERLREAPGEGITTLVTERVPLATRWLLAPTGGLALLAPHVLLITAPHVAVLAVADKEVRIRRHWASPMLPIIWLATVVGLARLRHPTWRAVGVALVIGGITGTYLLDSNLPGGGDYDPVDIVWTDRSEQMASLVSRVPADATVAASRRVLGFLANRPELYVFPPNYLGKLWPPEQRPQVYALDLTNDGTRDALAGRQSPLRTTRTPYGIWLMGPDAMLLTERLPSPTTRLDHAAGGVRLLGFDARRDGGTLDLTLHWSAPRRHTRVLTRILRVEDADGALVIEWLGTALDDLFPTTEWPDGQIVLDRVLVPFIGTAPARVLAGWTDAQGEPGLIELTVSESPRLSWTSSSR